MQVLKIIGKYITLDKFQFNNNIFKMNSVGLDDNMRGKRLRMLRNIVLCLIIRDGTIGGGSASFTRKWDGYGVTLKMD